MHGFFNINIWDKWKCVSLYFYYIVCFLWNMYSLKVFLWCSKKIVISPDALRNQTSRRKVLLELFKKKKNLKFIKWILPLFYYFITECYYIYCILECVVFIIFFFWILYNIKIKVMKYQCILWQTFPTLFMKTGN